MAEPWAPALDDVARKVPTRTRDTSTPGSDDFLGSFTPNTTPTDAQAQGFVDAAVAGVLAAVGAIPTTGSAADEVQAAARDAAAWQAAADIELAYPYRNANVNVSGQLQARANLALDVLREAIASGDVSTPGLLPVWQAPDPPTWADSLLL